MKDISPITQPIFRRKSPGIQPDANLIGALLNAIPEAAVVIHRSQGVVYTANSAFFLLTAFSQGEIANSPVRQLLPELDLNAVASGEIHTTALARRQRDTVPVKAQINRLDDGGQWTLLRVIPAEREVQDQNQIFQRTLSLLPDLLRLTEAESEDAAQKRAVQIVQTLLGCNLVCIYQAASDYPRLIKVATSEENEVFPDELPSSDLVPMDPEPIWSPGKRVTSSIQRAGRVANLEFVITLRLGQPGAWFGLLVAGDKQPHAPEDLLPLFDLVSTAVGTALQHYILVRQLEERVEQTEMGRLVRETVIAKAPAGVMILKPDLTICEMNDETASMLGYSKQEVIGRPVDSVLIGADQLMVVLDKALAGVSTDTLGRVNLHRRNGETFPGIIKTTPVMQDEVLKAVVVFVQDISELEYIRVKSEQLESRALIGQFTAMFAHEVRNPINNISTGVQLLESRMEENDPNVSIIRRMETDFNRLEKLMEELLAFSKPVAANYEPTDLKALVLRVFDRWRPRMERKNIVGFFKAEDNLPVICADMRSLEQVFTNLITNAIDAMELTGGTLAITIKSRDIIPHRPEIEITVSDSGPGIPDEVRDRVFEPFVTTKETGTGLGLAITKRIINAHRGDIHPSSFPGGTVFHIVLPVENGD